MVLDSAGLDELASEAPSERFRALLAEAARRGREVLAPSLACAELARGVPRTRRLEAAVARHDAGRGERPAVRLVDTDFALAKLVGALLEAAGRGSAGIVDAHVVALCVAPGGGLVVTSDPNDMAALAEAVPAVRVRTTPP